MAKPAKHPGKLDNRQLAFCRHYLVLNNATRAAVKAGYSKNGAKNAGSRLLAYPNVQIELSRLRQKANATVDLLLTARATGQPDPPIGKDVAKYAHQRSAVVLERAYLNQALMDVIEVGLGRAESARPNRSARGRRE